MYLKALKQIQPGEEIFASYGSGYWRRDEQYVTKYGGTLVTPFLPTDQHVTIESKRPSAKDKEELEEVEEMLIEDEEQEEVGAEEAKVEAALIKNIEKNLTIQDTKMDLQEEQKEEEEEEEERLLTGTRGILTANMSPMRPLNFSPGQEKQPQGPTRRHVRPIITKPPQMGRKSRGEPAMDTSRPMKRKTYALESPKKRHALSVQNEEGEEIVIHIINSSPEAVEAVLPPDHSEYFNALKDVITTSLDPPNVIHSTNETIHKLPPIDLTADSGDEKAPIIAQFDNLNDMVDAWKKTPKMPSTPVEEERESTANVSEIGEKNTTTIDEFEKDKLALIEMETNNKEEIANARLKFGTVNLESVQDTAAFLAMSKYLKNKPEELTDHKKHESVITSYSGSQNMPTSTLLELIESMKNVYSTIFSDPSHQTLNQKSYMEIGYFMCKHYGLHKKGTKFLDIGSGTGHVVFKLACAIKFEDRSTNSLHGIEILSGLYGVSAFILQSLNRISSLKMASTLFFLGDANAPGFDISSYTHIFTYDQIFPLDFYSPFYEKLADPKAKWEVFVATQHHNPNIEKTGDKRTTLGQIAKWQYLTLMKPVHRYEANTNSSEENYTIYFYVKRDRKVIDEAKKEAEAKIAKALQEGIEEGQEYGMIADVWAEIARKYVPKGAKGTTTALKIKKKDSVKEFIRS